MRLFLFVLLLALAGCGATLRVTGTAPLNGRADSCAGPSPYILRSSMWVHASVVGTAFRDSLRRNPGEPFEFGWDALPGDYQVCGWTQNVAGVGCSTFVSVTVEARPSAPVLIRSR